MTSPPISASSGAVLIPVKSFDRAKVRLSGALDGSDRATLARRMATHVVTVQQNVSVAVCCDDPVVAEWAEECGAQVIWCPDTGLNGAVKKGVDELSRHGFQHLAVAHGDLPLAASLDRLLGWPGITLVPDRHRAGTNVIALPAGLDFGFGYGTGSLRHHVREAVRLRRGLRITHDPGLGWDVDQPDDLSHPDADLLTGLLTTEGAP